MSNQPTQAALLAFFALLESIASTNANGVFQDTYLNRVQTLCDLKNCVPADLTLRELNSCLIAARLEYNQLSPVLHGMPPLPEQSVMQSLHYPQGSMV